MVRIAVTVSLELTGHLHTKGQFHNQFLQTVVKQCIASTTSKKFNRREVGPKGGREGASNRQELDQREGGKMQEKNRQRGKNKKIVEHHQEMDANSAKQEREREREKQIQRMTHLLLAKPGVVRANLQGSSRRQKGPNSGETELYMIIHGDKTLLWLHIIQWDT